MNDNFSHQGNDQEGLGALAANVIGQQRPIHQDSRFNIIGLHLGLTESKDNRYNSQALKEKLPSLLDSTMRRPTYNTAELC